MITASVSVNKANKTYKLSSSSSQEKITLFSCFFFFLEQKGWKIMLWNFSAVETFVYWPTSESSSVWPYIVASFDFLPKNSPTHPPPPPKLLQCMIAWYREVYTMRLWMHEVSNSLIYIRKYFNWRYYVFLVICHVITKKIVRGTCWNSHCKY